MPEYDRSKKFIVHRPFSFDGDMQVKGAEFDVSKLSETKLHRLCVTNHVLCSAEVFDPAKPVPDFQSMTAPELHAWLALNGSAQRHSSRSWLVRKALWMVERLRAGECPYDAASEIWLVQDETGEGLYEQKT